MRNLARRVVLLDSGPLGLITNPAGREVATRCQRWFRSVLAHQTRVLLPEIADYEVRRELIRADRIAGLRRLDQLKATIGYLPITTETMLLAAALWAEARRHGRPTADDKALDGDVILAAQARLVAAAGSSVTVATANVGHLARFVTAAAWQDIPPPT